MTDVRGYPVPPCPECKSADSAEIHGALLPDREFGPGEMAVCWCHHCDGQYLGIVPEPCDGYLGDGVFAKSH